jgi:hypothetical protein
MVITADSSLDPFESIEQIIAYLMQADAETFSAIIREIALENPSLANELIAAVTAPAAQ